MVPRMHIELFPLLEDGRQNFATSFQLSRIIFEVRVNEYYNPYENSCWLSIDTFTMFILRIIFLQIIP